MRISIVTMVGNEGWSPDDRRDAWRQAISCYTDAADEVVVVNGGTRLDISHPKVIQLMEPWPAVWSWSELPKHLNAGFSRATGDWVVRMDIDYFFHEDDLDQLRHELSHCHAAVAEFEKLTFVNRSQYYSKAVVPSAIHKEITGDRYGFGFAANETTDLCYPIEITGTHESGIPQGRTVRTSWQQLGVPIFNYDCFFKTKSIAFDDFWRFARAYQAFFQTAKFGSTPEDSWQVFCGQMKSRIKKAVHEVTGPYDHPVYIRDEVLSLEPDQFGYDNWQLNFSIAVQ